MTTVLAFPFSSQEIFLIFLVILLIFGASRIPALFRSLGRGMGEFKEGLREEKPKETEESRKGGPR